MDSAADEQGAEKSGACEQCVERCQREHRVAGEVGKLASPAVQPCFLRTVLEHNVRNNMAIPKAFVRLHGRGLLGSTVDLEGANGKIWLVSVAKSSTGTAVFRIGWHVFAADNNLKLGDAILFTMVAKNRFAVRVFNKNGLEPLNPTNASVAFGLDSTRTAKVGASHYTSTNSVDNFARSHHSGGSENGSRRGHGPTLQEIIQTGLPDSTGEDPVCRRSSGKVRRPKRHRRSPDGQHGAHGVPGEAPGANSTLYASRRRPVTDAERENALAESRKLVASVMRPSVAVVMMPSHVYRGFWLSLPNEFSRQYLPSSRLRITLRDTSGDDWGAQWIGDDAHNGISGGWAAFSKDHCLEEGDVCVFELLDSKSFVFCVHICRVLEVPSVPCKRGPTAWEVTYNIIKPDPALPDLNDEAKPEPDASPRVKRGHMADVLQDMIRSGKFSNLRREEYDSLPSKIRALAENSASDGDEDIKPDVKAISSQFKLPNAPFNLSSEVSVKAEPEDVHSASSLPAGRPSHTAPQWRPTGVQVKAGPAHIVKTEDVYAGELSPVAVYRRRHKKESSVSVPTSPDEDESRVWYPVTRVLRKRQREGHDEKEILVEVMGTVQERDRRRVEPGPEESWWVPSSHFASDMAACFFR